MTSSSGRNRAGRVAAAMALALAAPIAGACRKHPEAAKASVPAVTVRNPAEKPVTEYLEMTGTVAASKSVNLVARVPGYLEKVNFKDGDIVQEGQVLFEIERPPYEQQVALNEAALVRAQAELERQQGMLAENATAKSTVENWESQRDQAKAQLELAKINLGYTRVTAPFTGRVTWPPSMR